MGTASAGEKDAGHSQPVGHVIGVGKNSVGTRLGKRKRPPLDLADEGEDSDPSHKEAVGLEDKSAGFFSDRSGQEPKEPKGGGGEHQNGFQSDPQLILFPEDGG